MAAPKKKAAKKKAAKKTAKKKSSRKKKVEPMSRGLAPAEQAADPPDEIGALQQDVEGDGGAVLATYRDPLGGHWQLLVSVPIDKVAPTPFQRDLSKPHVSRLQVVLDKLDRFLDPIVTVRTDDGKYWTPNGNHRLAAMREVGAKSIVCLLVPEFEIAHKILALNTEKAHSLGEKCLEVIRMAHSLAESSDQPESSYALEFEDPAYLTLGCIYEEQSRFSGSSYTSVLKKLEGFFDEPLETCLERRGKRAVLLQQLDEAVVAGVKQLKDAGFLGSSLKGFVIGAANPLDSKTKSADFDETITAMIEAAQAFDHSKLDTSELPRTA